jgi:ribosomal protein L40E
MQQNIINTQPRFCYKCHCPAGAFDKQCRRCGCAALRTKATIRILGGVLVFLGGFISALMAFIGMFIYGALMHDGGASRFKGSDTELLLVIGIIALTFVVGVSFALAGLWQMIFGRRNSFIVWVSISLVITLLVIGKIFVALTS